jgi:hypothetical protein
LLACGMDGTGWGGLKMVSGSPSGKRRNDVVGLSGLLTFAGLTSLGMRG